MAAVIRVKRRVDEEPLNAFVLNCKRRKVIENDTEREKEVNEATEEEVSTILRFAGTINDGDDLKTHITRLSKVEAEETARKTRKPSDITLRNRKQFKEDSHRNRFEVVNCTRSLEDSDKNYTIVDVVKHEDNDAKHLDTSPTNGEQATQEISGTSTVAASGENITSSDAASSFVYDLYFADNNEQTEFDDNLFDNLISIHPYSGLYNYREDVAESDYDSEDSNDENNWRNEYPDTDEEFSIGEDDMRKAVEDLNIGSDSDLSSDEPEYGDEPVVHFLEHDEMTEYQYFKKYGHLRANKKYYRKKGSGHGTTATESDEPKDSDSDREISASDVSSEVED